MNIYFFHVILGKFSQVYKEFLLTSLFPLSWIQEKFFADLISLQYHIVFYIYLVLLLF